MRKLNLLLVLFLGGCNSEPSGCKIYASDILNKYSSIVYVVTRKKNNILGIADYGRGKLRGGAYYFYPDGMLRYYKFFQKDSAYNYDEEYNEKGEFVKSVGRPLVDEEIKEITKDSVFITFYFFALHKVYQAPRISFNNNLAPAIALNTDTTFSNMKSVSIGINHKNLHHFKVILSCDYLNECTLKESPIYDTLSFIKNPELNLEE
jgi:hypothetical protein